MCNPLNKKEYTPFYSFWGSFNPHLPKAYRRFFRPRLLLWHWVLTITAKLEAILESHESNNPLEAERGHRKNTSQQLYVEGKVCPFRTFLSPSNGGKYKRAKLKNLYFTFNSEGNNKIESLSLQAANSVFWGGGKFHSMRTRFSRTLVLPDLPFTRVKIRSY